MQMAVDKKTYIKLSKRTRKRLERVMLDYYHPDYVAAIPALVTLTVLFVSLLLWLIIEGESLNIFVVGIYGFVTLICGFGAGMIAYLLFAFYPALRKAVRNGKYKLHVSEATGKSESGCIYADGKETKPVTSGTYDRVRCGDKIAVLTVSGDSQKYSFAIKYKREEA